MSDQTLVGPSERELRRPDFVGGIPIELADHQPYYFAEPRVRLVPSDAPLGYELCLDLDDCGKFNKAVSRYHELLGMDRETFAKFSDEFLASELAMARMMLERNYTMTLSQMQAVLQFSHDSDKDPEGSEIRRSIIRVINGDVPKRSADGEGLSGSPSAQ